MKSMRWAPGAVQSWRVPGEGGFTPGNYGVAPIEEATAKAYILDRHYSGTYPAARLRFGLFDAASGPKLVGAAVLSVPASKKVLTNVFPGLEPYSESLELGRFVLDDEVPANGESWFLGQLLRQAAEDGLRGVVSFSDPLPRTKADGSVIMPGHVGTIYQASNARYLGRATPRTLALLPDGTVFSARAMQKIRDQDQGHEYAEAHLIAFGAQPMRAYENPARWLREALAAAGVRPLRHQGNHRYAFATGRNRGEKNRVVIDGQNVAYPKQRDYYNLAA